ncbi:MAG: aminoacyl-tRNA hydrolase [Hyphomicrobiales bacterium]|nr:aminoacyl-tRNA hydrolase [Hyphomicrobiales bacterium]
MLLVGLGNPGEEYANTRHNAGFMAVDAIASAYDFPEFREKYSGLLSEKEINGVKVRLFKPQAYMNRSGNPVQRLMAFYKVPLSELVVIHDDIDLALGKVRIKTGGGAGGHNGLRDLDMQVGKEYRRIRIGVGHPGARWEVRDYVLQAFAQEESATLVDVLKALAGGLPMLLVGEDEKLMTRIAMQLHGPE